MADDLLNLESDEDNNRPPSALLAVVQDLENAAMEVVNHGDDDHLNGAHLNDDDEEDDYSSLDYSSSEGEMDDHDPLGTSSDEEDIPPGVQDLAEALNSSDEDADLGASSDEDVDLRGFRHFMPVPERLSEDSRDGEISDSALDRIIAGWYWPTGSAPPAPRVGESPGARMASERLLLQEVDLIPCVYCSNVRCSRIRHYSLNTGLCNLQEDQEKVQGKTLDETPGAYVHPIKNCSAFLHSFVDINGHAAQVILC